MPNFLIITPMTNSYLYSYNSKETFTEQQIEEISEAITKAVEDIMEKQYLSYFIENRSFKQKNNCQREER